MAVVFMNRLNGVINFACIGGDFSGKQISVRYLNKTWHEDQWARGSFSYLTREQFETQILGSIGIVHDAGRPVSAAIVCEVNANLSLERRPGGHVVNFLCTGIESHLRGWRRMDLLEQDRMFPTAQEEAEDSILDRLPGASDIGGSLSLA